ncbi:hypothetical protein [Nonomuraea polychroma]|uniref:hypothetical protein n=1 Tax=Nonomuraea polychroma TaxID=46176 RepID=UPI000FDD3094|nr:hypothetical protein [Nonomuraea polychroma]
MAKAEKVGVARTSFVSPFRFFCHHCMFVHAFAFMRSGIFAMHRRATRCPEKPFLAMEGNQLVSRMSSAASRAGATGRLLTWAVATTMACGAVGLSGATTSAHAATGSKGDAVHQQVYRESGPWLDSAFVALSGGTTGSYEGQLFAVTSDRGVAWVYDPRLPAGQRWQSLRRVPGSQGGYVFNVSVAGDHGSLDGSGDVQLVIRARTASGTFETRCDVQAKGIGPAAPEVPVLFPTSGLLNNCTQWAVVRP